MSAWNFATIWETVAANVPDAPAVLQGERVVSWADFDARANGVARWLLGAPEDTAPQDVAQQDKVALYLFNCPEYLEACFACFKAGLVPVNTNYRYADDELAYLWDNADAVAVIFHASLAEHIEHIRHRLPRVKRWLWVDDATIGGAEAMANAPSGPPPTNRPRHLGPIGWRRLGGGATTTC